MANLEAVHKTENESKDKLIEKIQKNILSNQGNLEIENHKLAIICSPKQTKNEPIRLMLKHAKVKYFVKYEENIEQTLIIRYTGVDAMRALSHYLGY